MSKCEEKKRDPEVIFPEIKAIRTLMEQKELRERLQKSVDENEERLDPIKKYLGRKEL